jgi:hypothetical protein
MVVDTSRTVAISGSLWKTAGLGLLGIGMMALSISIGLPLQAFGSVGVLERAVGVVGGLFFGACTLLILGRALTNSGPVVTLTRSGIRDKRLAAGEIPWSAIRGISTWALHGQKVMVLAVDPVVEATIGLSRIARMSRVANRSLGADGLCISAQGLTTSYEQLLDLTVAYAEAHGCMARPEVAA